MAPSKIRLLQNFIIPALDSGKYSNKLYWLNKEEGIFRIYWSHKNAAQWTEDDAIVFKDWDKHKGHFKPANKNYFMCAKQRFRAALYKLSPHVTKLECPDKDHRDYQLSMNGNKKPSKNLVKSKTKMPQKKKGLINENRSLEEIPQKSPREVLETSVLRENSSTPRIPHIAPQPIPVYCSYKLFSSRHYSLQDSPEVFVSKTYNGQENMPQM